MKPSEVKREIHKIIAERESRDIWVLQDALLPAAMSLRKTFLKWKNGEMSALYSECEMLKGIAPPQARGKLVGIKMELDAFETRRIGEARDKLQAFIRAIESQKMQNPKEVGDEVQHNLWPTLEVITDLMNIRDRLDTMTSMIPASDDS